MRHASVSQISTRPSVLPQPAPGQMTRDSRERESERDAYITLTLPKCDHMAALPPLLHPGWTATTQQPPEPRLTPHSPTGPPFAPCTLPPLQPRHSTLACPPQLLAATPSLLHINSLVLTPKTSRPRTHSAALVSVNSLEVAYFSYTSTHTHTHVCLLPCTPLE